MFSYDEPTAEERIIKALTSKETGRCRFDNPEYAILAIHTARVLDKELDVLLLKLYNLEQEIDNLESALSDCGYREESLKEDINSDWRRTVARESARRMRSVVDRVSNSHYVVLVGDKWRTEYYKIFGKEE